jgi:hypothetical protein
VRELRQLVFGVLDAAGAFDPRSVLLRRPPEDGFVDPTSLADELLPQAESLEHLDRAAGDAVGLADLQRAVATFNQPCADAGEVRQLRGQQRPGRPAANDENVDGDGSFSLRMSGSPGAYPFR